MDKNTFLYWLQGFFEIRDNNEPLTLKQVQTILAHLAIVPGFKADKYLNWLERVLVSLKESNCQDTQLTTIIQVTLPGNFKNITSAIKYDTDAYCGTEQYFAPTFNRGLSNDLSKIRVC